MLNQIITVPQIAQTVHLAITPCTTMASSTNPIDEFVTAVITAHELRKVLLQHNIIEQNNITTVYNCLLHFHFSMWNNTIEHMITFCQAQVNQNTEQTTLSRRLLNDFECLGQELNNRLYDQRFLRQSSNMMDTFLIILERYQLTLTTLTEILLNTISKNHADIFGSVITMDREIISSIPHVIQKFKNALYYYESQIQTTVCRLERKDIDLNAMKLVIEHCKREICTLFTALTLEGNPEQQIRNMLEYKSRFHHQFEHYASLINHS